MSIPRPSDVEFDELKRKRDAAVSAIVDEVCTEQGWDRGEVGVHVSPAGDCYCACPDGPCQHVWDGPEWTDAEEGSPDRFTTSSATCSRCGTPAIFHDIRCSW